MPASLPADPYNCIIARVDEDGPSSHRTGPLADLSFAVKDLFDVAGMPTTAGNPDYARWRGIPTRDAWAVRALRQAGARLVAKTHLHELAWGITGINPHFGTPQNPAAPGRLPGGSSSGSAVAVAAGLVDFSLGSDTGGSNRVPASFCGIFGMRPTHGRIPEEGVTALAPSFDSVGVFAADADTLERAATQLLQPARDITGFGHGLVLTDGFGYCEASARDAVLRVRTRLQDIGLSMGEAQAGCLQEAYDAQILLQSAEAWAEHRAWIQRHSPQLGTDVAALLERSRHLDAGDLGWASAARARITHLAERLLGDDSFALLPAAPGPAPLLSELADQRHSLAIRQKLLVLTYFASLAGLPVVVIPAAIGGALPIGVQIIGPRGSDMALLKLATELG